MNLSCNKMYGAQHFYGFKLDLRSQKCNHKLCNFPEMLSETYVRAKRIQKKYCVVFQNIFWNFLRNVDRSRH